MIILGIILTLFAIGLFCWLLFIFAVYALPFFVGMTAALVAHQHGVGLLGASLIAVIAGVGTFALGKILFAAVRVPILRICIALVFVVPAALAGYRATLGIAHICISAGSLSRILAFAGASLVDGAAWSRMAIFVPPATAQGTQDESVPPQFSSTVDS